MTALAEIVTAIPTPVLTAVIALTSIAATVVLVVKAIKDLQGPVSTVSSLVTTAMGYMDPLYVKILLIVAAVTALVAVIAVLVGKSQELNSAMNSVTNVTDSTMSNANRQLPAYATGTRRAARGTALVGENGPELINLRGGERIYNSRETSRALSGGNTYHITIDASRIQEFNDIVAICQNEAVSIRQGVRKA